MNVNTLIRLLYKHESYLKVCLSDGTEITGIVLSQDMEEPSRNAIYILDVQED